MFYSLSVNWRTRLHQGHWSGYCLSSIIGKLSLTRFNYNMSCEYIEFYNIGSVNDKEIKFAIISAIYKDKWVYIKHKGRNSEKSLVGIENQEKQLKKQLKKTLIWRNWERKNRLTPYLRLFIGWFRSESYFFILP